MFLVESGKRNKLGTLDNIDLDKLKRKIYALLSKHRTVGIHLVEADEKGVLHRPNVYQKKMDGFLKTL